MCSLCCHDVFQGKMRSVINLHTKKVVYNLLICLILKFRDFRPAGLGVIDFTNSLSGLVVLCTVLKHGIF